MIETKDLEAITELFQRYDEYRTGIGEAHGPKVPIDLTMSRIGMILNNLKDQADRVIVISRDARRNPEREDAALQCESVIRGLRSLYDATEEAARKINFADRKPVEQFMRDTLDEVDRVATEIRKLAEGYMAERGLQA